MSLVASVIIPHFNNTGGLRKAVTSALDQTVPNIEVIVVDDGSTPKANLATALPADNRIRIVTHSVNRGAAAARNTGRRAATGAWLAYLDSDDVWHPRKLEAQLAFALAAEANGASGDRTVYAGGWRRIGADASVHEFAPRPASTMRGFAHGCWFCPGSTSLMRREAAELVGDQDEQLRRLEDYDWFLRFAALGGALRVSPSCMADVHRGKAPPPVRVAEAERLLAAKYLDSRSPLYCADPVVRRRIGSYLALSRASAAVRSGHWAEGAAALLKSLVLVPRVTLQLDRLWSRVAGEVPTPRTGPADGG